MVACEHYFLTSRDSDPHIVPCELKHSLVLTESLLLLHQMWLKANSEAVTNLPVLSTITNLLFSPFRV